MFTKRARRTFGGILLTTGLSMSLTVATPASSLADTAGDTNTPVPDDAVTEVLSYEQYVNLYGAPPADADSAGSDSADAVETAMDLETSLYNTVGDTPTGPEEGQATPWDTVLTSTRTWEGKYAPTRYGTQRLAWAKACGKHNVCNYRLFNTAYQGYCKEPSGSRCVYIALVLYNGKVVQKIRVIHDSNNYSQYGRTRDGREVGTITAYCEGLKRCPAYVNGS